MRYYIQRYCDGLRKIQKWLPCVLLPSVVYLLVVSASPDRYSVIQKVAVQKNAPISLSRTPVEVTPMTEMITRPAELFLDDFTLLDLDNAIQAISGLKNGGYRNLRSVIESSMTLNPEDDGSVLLSYYGHDIDLGKILVDFYTQRLIARSKDGLVRSMRNPARAGVSETSGGPPQLHAARPAGTDSAMSSSRPAATEGAMRIHEHRTFWRPDRLLPALEILAGALVIWLILAGFVELADTSLKTERQVSRYLDLPVIGAMPDLDQLYQCLQPKKPSQ